MRKIYPHAGAHTLRVVFIPDPVRGYAPDKQMEKTIAVHVRRAVPRVVWRPSQAPVYSVGDAVWVGERGSDEVCPAMLHSCRDICIAFSLVADFYQPVSLWRICHVSLSHLLVKIL